jgi:hypothetical protein
MPLVPPLDLRAAQEPDTTGYTTTGDHELAIIAALRRAATAPEPPVSHWAPFLLAIALSGLVAGLTGVVG